MEWYNVGVQEVLEELGSSKEGLTSNEALNRLKQYGENRVAEGKPVSRLQLLLGQFKNPLVYMLLFAGFVTFLLEEHVDAAVIFSVVVLNAFVGFFQEYKAEESARALKKMLAAKATVLRDNRRVEIDMSQLVLGDVVFVSPGSQIPADLRLLEAVEFSVDESALSGESLPVEKTTEKMQEEGLISSDQKNMAFLGTHVASGRATGVVVASGSNTVMGRIAEDVGGVVPSLTPLQKNFKSLAKYISIITLVASSMLFLFGLLVGESIREMFKVMIAASVATIPEGLPIVVTIAMAIGISRMARRNAIVKKMPAVETLGSTTIICSDKTGTLTKNEMTVKKMWAGGRILDVGGDGYSLEGRFLNHEGEVVKPGGDFETLLKVGVLCNNAGLQDGGVMGKPTEASVLVAAVKAGIDLKKIVEENPRTGEYPFSSETKKQITVHETAKGRIAYCLGAPDIIIKNCEKILVEGVELDLTQEYVDRVLSENSAFASSAFRVLGTSYKKVDANDSEGVGENMVFSGLFAIIDPPRPDAIEAVKGCRNAGIKVVMVTGDHVETATAIAKKIGIGGENPKVMSGSELAEITDEQLFEIVGEVDVFARVTSKHKLRIVQQLMEHGEIVAVTGDGVNDAPALKAAHIGISMGKTGSDVAKESSDMILSDDNFASIFLAVKEGRVVYSNIKKVTFFLLPTGLAAIISIIACMIMGLKIPYLATQLLWINLVTNGLQDVALAFEPGETHLINKKPRKRGEKIMSKIMVERTIIVAFVIALGVLTTYVISLNNGDSLEQARTVAVTTMVLFQFFHLLNSRSETNSILKTQPMSNPFLF
ncbi:MAG: HAD-IC family P-type ATPase, partial [Candidatus Altiarchaeales archaeon]|nr:HAD-IC family P-type ATPase [Candidatus Altiarchaeales archaeon]